MGNDYEDLQKKVYLTESEGMRYTSLCRSSFRKWAEKIGAKRKIQDSRTGRIVYLKETIDKAIVEGRR